MWEKIGLILVSGLLLSQQKFTKAVVGHLTRAESQSTLVYLDLKIIELSHQGQSTPQIGQLLGLHQEKLKAYDKAYWEDVLSQPPSSFEPLATPEQNWTYELIQQYIEKYLQLKVTISTIWNHLRRVGFTSGRAKLSITSPDPASEGVI